MPDSSCKNSLSGHIFSGIMIFGVFCIIITGLYAWYSSYDKYPELNNRLDQIYLQELKGMKFSSVDFFSCYNRYEEETCMDVKFEDGSDTLHFNEYPYNDLNSKLLSMSMRHQHIIISNPSLSHDTYTKDEALSILKTKIDEIMPFIRNARRDIDAKNSNIESWHN